MIPLYKSNDIPDFLDRFLSRKQDVNKEVTQIVQDILLDVKQKKDEALFAYTLQFDRCDLKSTGLRVTAEEIKAAVSQVSEDFLDIIREAADNVRKYHEKGKPQSWITWEENGVMLGQKVTPLKRAGLYVPGGRAFYPSSLIMASMPAQVAGVHEIAAVTPPGKDGKIDPSVLATAFVLGITEIYKVGGAQGVAAMAFGTESIKTVDIIVGPGNIYVAEAKRQVYGICDIDMVAGPSEVVLLCDDSVNPDYAASDLLAQAEHDPSASSICILDNAELAEKIKEAVIKQAAQLKRQPIFEESLEKWSGILVVDSMEAGIDLVNTLAPEHLGLHVADPWEILGKIDNAGAIFLGHYSPESVGDYWAGPNHILPTGQTARFSSPLGTENFLKRSSVIQYTKEALQKDGAKIMTFANMEGLDAHANAVKQRIN